MYTTPAASRYSFGTAAGGTYRTSSTICRYWPKLRRNPRRETHRGGKGPPKSTQVCLGYVRGGDSDFIASMAESLMRRTPLRDHVRVHSRVLGQSEPLSLSQHPTQSARVATTGGPPSLLVHHPFSTHQPPTSCLRIRETSINRLPSALLLFYSLPRALAHPRPQSKSATHGLA